MVPVLPFCRIGRRVIQARDAKLAHPDGRREGLVSNNSKAVDSAAHELPGTISNCSFSASASGGNGATIAVDHQVIEISNTIIEALLARRAAVVILGQLNSNRGINRKLFT